MLCELHPALYVLDGSSVSIAPFIISFMHMSVIYEHVFSLGPSLLRNRRELTSS